MNQNTPSLRSKLVNAVFQFLVPTARFLLRGGVSCAEFTELVQLAFVKAAAADYGERGREANSSRIAAVTGLSRREVARLKIRVEDLVDDPRTGLSPIGDLLQRWHTDEKYLSSDGLPLPLALDGESPTLRDLVSATVADFPVRAMRSELLRSGVATETPDGRLIPVARQAVPTIAEEKLLTSLTFNLRALVSTIAHNSNPDRREPGRIERFVYGPKLSAKNRDLARTRIRYLITKYSTKIDDELRELHEAQGAQSTEDKRVGVGFFYFEE
jgi:hypothetical protein